MPVLGTGERAAVELLLLDLCTGPVLQELVQFRASQEGAVRVGPVVPFTEQVDREHTAGSDGAGDRAPQVVETGAGHEGEGGAGEQQVSHGELVD